jgi:hypothetical protein
MRATSTVTNRITLETKNPTMIWPANGAGWTLLFTVIGNGYPAMLQRYNRALLAQRFGPPRHLA